MMLFLLPKDSLQDETNGLCVKGTSFISHKIHGNTILQKLKDL